MLKKSKFNYIGMYRLPWTCDNVLCSDGKQRQAKITGEALDAFCIPAQVHVYDKEEQKMKTVTGFITYDSAKEVHVFHAYTYLTNGHLLP